VVRGGTIGFAEARESVFVSSMDSAEKIFEEARRAGIDLNLVDLKLEMTPEDRVTNHDSALQLMLALREARNSRDEFTAIASAAE
jgi:hypothetical protein